MELGPISPADPYCCVAYSTLISRNDPQAMLARSSSRGNAVAAKSWCPSQLIKRYVTGREQFKNMTLRLASTARRTINLTGRKTSLIVCKLHVDPGQLGRHPRPSQRRLAAEFLLFIGKRAAAHLQRRPYGSRRHAVDANSFGSQLFGKRLYEVHRCRFRLRIIIKFRTWIVSLLRRGGDNARSGRQRWQRR